MNGCVGGDNHILLKKKVIGLSEEKGKKNLFLEIEARQFKTEIR